MIDRKSRSGVRRIGHTGAFGRTRSHGSLPSSFAAPFYHRRPQAALLFALAVIGPVQAYAQEEPRPLPTVVGEQQGELAPKVNVAAKTDRLPTPPPPASDMPSEDAAVPARLVDSLVQLGVEERIEQAFAESRMPARFPLAWPDMESLVAYASSTNPTAQESTATASLPEAEIDEVVTGAIPREPTPEAGVSPPSPKDIPAAAALSDEEPKTPLPQEQPQKEQPEPARTAASTAATEEQATPPQRVEATPESQSGPTLPPSLLPTGEQN